MKMKLVLAVALFAMQCAQGAAGPSAVISAPDLLGEINTLKKRARMGVTFALTNHVSKFLQANDKTIQMNPKLARPAKELKALVGLEQVQYFAPVPFSGFGE